jgi:hypothetical protein
MSWQNRGRTNGETFRLFMAAAAGAGLTCCVLVACFVGVVTAAFLGGYIAWVPQDQPPALPTPLVTPKSLPQHLYLTPTPQARPSVAPSAQSQEQSWPSVVALERAVVPERDLYDLTRRLRHMSVPIRATVPPRAGGYSIGDRETFWIADNDANSYFTATATLRVVTAHTYFWVEDDYSVDDADLQRSAQRFERQIYPTDRRVFGSEWTPGIDGDVHLHVFNGRVPGVGGYFSSADEYPRLINPFSNQKEMFYINLDNARPGTDYYDGILAHEFQHMIHWNVDRNEDTWLNEGFAELATRLNKLNVGNVEQAFRRQPDTQLNTWADEPRQAAPHYGGSYRFFAYLLGRWGEGLIRQIAMRQDNGIESVQSVLVGRGTSFDRVFADWVIANALDRDEPGGGRYNYPLLNVLPVAVQASHRQYPVLRSGSVHQYAADYIELLPDAPGTLQVTFQGATDVKIVPNAAHSGRFEWWSNRGDQSDMTLTRPFDLRRLASATLNVWLWYDIEQDYDYAYIEVSTDQGNTWNILRGRHATAANPNANSFGWAYTGVSLPENLPAGEAQGEETPRWIRETLDLTPFAGRQILLRFEYITDDAINKPGFAIDDVSIPELGFRDDFERDDGGWSADGFVRIDNRLPQRFIVQAVIETADPNGWHVQTMALDHNQRGVLTVPNFGRDVSRVLVVIAGMTEHTAELAEYEYQAAVGPPG